MAKAARRYKRIKPLYRTKTWRKFIKQVRQAYRPQFRGWRLKHVVAQYAAHIATQIDMLLMVRNTDGSARRITEIELITEDEADEEKLYTSMWDNIGASDVFLQYDSKSRKTNSSVNSTIGMMMGLAKEGGLF